MGKCLEQMEGYRNGYRVVDDADGEAINQELGEIYKKHWPVNCIICNEEMSWRFQVGLLGHRTVTINNNVPDRCFFLNGRY